MISVPSIIFVLISLFICLALPAVLALVLILKHKASWKAFVLGIAVFTVFQFLTRVPILNALQGEPSYILFAQTNTILYGILLALSAGVFEETGRLVGMRFFMQKDLTWKNGLTFGLGHAGVEAFVLVGIPYVGVLAGLLSGDLAYAAVPPATFLLGGVERLLTIAFHIGMTMLVLYAVKRREIRWFIFAILFHTAADTIAVLFAGGDAWMLEGIVAIFAALGVYIVVRFKNKIDSIDLQTKWRF